MWTIRSETEEDHFAVYELNKQAFGTDSEAILVDKLREVARPTISLVAIDEGNVVGHLMLSPVTITGPSGAVYESLIMGLAPMAVLPEMQRRGIGRALINAGLSSCKDQGMEAVVVLGHPDYYPQSGFYDASRFGLSCEFEAPPGCFMAQELEPGALSRTPGVVHYHPVFREL